MDSPVQPAADAIVEYDVPKIPWWSFTANDSFLIHTPYPPPVGFTILTEAHHDGFLSEVQKRMFRAVHEAGHAVIGLTTGLPLGAVVLHDPPIPSYIAGVHSFGHIHLGAHHALYHDLLAFHAAGVRAGHRWLADTKMLTGLTAYINDVIHGFNDRQRTLAAQPSRPIQLSYGTGRPPDLPAGTAFLDMAEVYTRVDALLEQRWPAVIAIANELAQRGHLEHDDWRAIAERARTPTETWWEQPNSPTQHPKRRHRWRTTATRWLPASIADPRNR